MAFCAYCGNQVVEVSFAPCPRCGRPSNGAAPGTVAPPLPGKSGGSRTAIIVVIVLVAAFFLIAIIGILAAIAIPNFVRATDMSRQIRTKANLRSLATAYEAYANVEKHYPKAWTVEELRPLLTPTYIKEMPSEDGWGHRIRFETWTEDQKHPFDHYAIGSPGKDGTFERVSLKDYRPETVTQSFNADIVYANGNFVQYPDPTQPPR